MRRVSDDERRVFDFAQRSARNLTVQFATPAARQRISVAFLLIALEFVEGHAKLFPPAYELDAVIRACEDAADDARDRRRVHRAAPCRRRHAAKTACL